VRFVKVVAIAMSTLALSSCKYGYDIAVFVRNGHIVFKLGNGGRTPRVNLFQVEEISRRSHAVWRLETTQANGPELSDLQYGRVPNRFKETVPAKRLEVGRVYRVGLFAVNGVGEQAFAISESGEILKVSR